MVLAAGKHHLIDAVESAEVARFCNSTVVCNPGGSSLMQHLQDLSAKVSGLDAKLSDQGAKHSAQLADLEAKHSAQLADLDAKVSSLLPFKDYFLDVRERAFLTYLRDYWRDYGASRQKHRPSPVSPVSKVHARISSLNKYILHGGNAEVDALMFVERHPIEEIAPFQHLYGLEPDLVKKLGNSYSPTAVLFLLLTHGQILASKGHRSIINLLNAAGAVHYESHHMKNVHQEAFDKVIDLVHSGNFEDAEEAAAAFPFATDFVELAGVTPIDEQED
jgi:hypothetical protein